MVKKMWEGLEVARNLERSLAWSHVTRTCKDKNFQFCQAAREFLKSCQKLPKAGNCFLGLLEVVKKIWEGLEVARNLERSLTW